MADQNSPRGFGAAARVTALAASVMDLHVRIALQEVDREKRRLISGGLFLAIGGTAMFLALLAGEASLLLWIQAQWDLDWMRALLSLAVANLVLAGISLRIGGQVLKGPFLPQTLGTDENGAGSDGTGLISGCRSAASGSQCRRCSRESVARPSDAGLPSGCDFH